MSRSGDPDDAWSWGRGTPARCGASAALRDGGEAGERWWPAHLVARSEGAARRGELCSRAAGRQEVRKASIDPSCHSGSASRSSRNLRYCASCSGSLALSR